MQWRYVGRGRGKVTAAEREEAGEAGSAARLNGRMKHGK